eukprot:g42.t1
MKGYALSGKQPSCNAGVFDPGSIVCTAEQAHDCKDFSSLSAPENGTIGSACLEGNILGENEKCDMQCNEGYERKGEQAICIAGALNKNTITCSAKSCTVTGLVAPLNAHALPGSCSNGSILKHAESCELTCMDGYHVSGEQPKCTTGVFDAGTITCVPNSCTVKGMKSIENGNEIPDECTNGSVIKHGEKCSLTCKKGYHVSGMMPSCSAGTFDPGWITCDPNDCTVPLDFKVSVYGMSENCLPGKRLHHGSFCKVFCRPSYVLSGLTSFCHAGKFQLGNALCLHMESVGVCNGTGQLMINNVCVCATYWKGTPMLSNGRWNNPCIPKLVKPLVITGGGHVIYSDPDGIAENGEWKATLICPAPKVPRWGSFSVSKDGQWLPMKLSCIEGRPCSGYGTHYQSGKCSCLGKGISGVPVWDKNIGIDGKVGWIANPCWPIALGPISIDGGVVEYTYSATEKIWIATLKCKIGFQLTGPSAAKGSVSLGYWNPKQLGRCRNREDTCSGVGLYSYRGGCECGRYFSGHPVWDEKNGMWKNTCFPTICGRLDIQTKHGHISYFDPDGDNSNDKGWYARLHCDDGYIVHGASTAMCNEKENRWESIGTCVKL